jgi:hypothetical protein
VAERFVVPTPLVMAYGALRASTIVLGSEARRRREVGDRAEADRLDRRVRANHEILRIIALQVEAEGGVLE